MALTSEWCVMSWWLLQATAMASLFTSNAWYPPNWPPPKPSPFKACRPTAMPSNSDSTFGLAPGCHAGWRGGGLQNSHSHLPAGTSRSPTHLKCATVVQPPPSQHMTDLPVPFAHVALIIMHGLAAFIACAAILAGAIGPMFGQVVRWALGIAANTT